MEQRKLAQDSMEGRELTTVTVKPGKYDYHKPFTVTLSPAIHGMPGDDFDVWSEAGRYLGLVSAAETQSQRHLFGNVSSFGPPRRTWAPAKPGERPAHWQRMTRAQAIRTLAGIR